jgi:hypothetical protein
MGRRLCPLDQRLGRLIPHEGEEEVAGGEVVGLLRLQ